MRSKQILFLALIFLGVGNQSVPLVSAIEMQNVKQPIMFKPLHTNPTVVNAVLCFWMKLDQIDPTQILTVPSLLAMTFADNVNLYFELKLRPTSTDTWEVKNQGCIHSISFSPFSNGPESCAVSDPSWIFVIVKYNHKFVA